MTASALPSAARSFLFVPGDRPERFAKAAASGADVVILDLEDAVAPDRKPLARAEVAAYLNSGGQAVVRINDQATAWFAEDLSLVGLPGLLAVMLPKAETAAGVTAVGAPVIALVETARGVASVEAIAGAPGVARIAFGTIDLMKDLGIPEDGEAFAPFRSRLALASRVAGLPPPIDGVTPTIDDDARIIAETERSLRFGFSAKMCIHPKQVAIVHAAMMPAAGAIAEAEAIVAAYEAAGGAFALNGRMIDLPVYGQARALLARAGRDRLS